jgi:hypothetical protein
MLRFFFSHLHHISNKRDNNFTSQIFFSITAWKSFSPKLCLSPAKPENKANKERDHKSSLWWKQRKEFQDFAPPPEIHIQKTTQCKPKLRSERKLRKQLMMIKRILHAIKMRETQNPNLILREHPHDKQTKTHMHTLTS